MQYLLGVFRAEFSEDDQRNSLLGLWFVLVLYPPWAFLAQLLYRGAKDSVVERLIVASPALILLTANFLVKKFKPKTQIPLGAVLHFGLTAQAYLVTWHFFSLVRLNLLHPIYAIGAFVVMSACIALFNDRLSLLGYSIFVIPLSAWVVALGETYFKIYYTASVATALLVNTLGTLSRLRSLESERLARKLIAQQQEQLVSASRLAAVGEMSGGIAHEINTPLATIQISADLLKELSKDPSVEPSVLRNQVLHFADTIDKTVTRTAMIVRGLLTFSRGGSYEEPKELALRQLVDETLFMCVNRFQNEAIELEVQIDPSLSVACGKTTFGQAFLNTLNNALDATQGLACRKIRLHATTDGAWTELHIEDNGHGIPRAIADQIFLPFFTTKEIGKGTGLGMSISKGLIEKAGGQISFESLEQGTRFTIRLPANMKHAQSGVAG